MSDKRQSLDIDETAKQLEEEEGKGFFRMGKTPAKEPEPGPTQAHPDDPVKAYGIGLKVSEWETIDEIAKEMGKTRHALALWALRDFLKRYNTGEIQTVTQKTLPGL